MTRSCSGDDRASRREFLATTAAVGVGAAVGGLFTPSAATASPRMGGSPAHFRVLAVRDKQVFADGSIIPFFRFQAISNTPTNGKLPLLRATEGAEAVLTVANKLPFAIQPMIVGGELGPVIPAESVGRFTFTMPAAGTWLVTDAQLGPASGPAGFGAVLISDPKGGPPAYDREYTLLYQDTDDRWNFDIDDGKTPDTSAYEPNYHTVNGLTFPHTTTDADTLIACNVGDNVLIRFANLGHVRQSIHFHGYHVQILARNNVPNATLPEKDTFGLPGYTTADILLPAAQGGVYPVHPHSLTMVTDNGLYPYGQILLISAK